MVPEAKLRESEEPMRAKPRLAGAGRAFPRNPAQPGRWDEKVDYIVYYFAEGLNYDIDEFFGDEDEFLDRLVIEPSFYPLIG